MSAAGDSRSWLVRAQSVNARLQGNPGHAHGEVIDMARMNAAVGILRTGVGGRVDRSQTIEPLHA